MWLAWQLCTACCCCVRCLRPRCSAAAAVPARSLADLHGLMHFLHFFPLAERHLFTRTLERPIKAGDPAGLLRLQVPPAPPGTPSAWHEPPTQAGRCRHAEASRACSEAHGKLAE